MKKILLIDGHSILHRAFFGMPDLTNAKGVHTGAVYGFLSILFRTLEEENPDYLAIAFDVHAPTFRHEKYNVYKGTRKPMPEELREQVPIIKDVLKAMDICVVEQAGLEADDILGTLAVSAEKNGMEVSVLSGDRDLLQIATDHIRIRIPKTVKGETSIHDYYAKDVLAEYRVTPSEFIDVKALMGDSSDNVPGIPKVGEKTATELIEKYHSVAGVYEHLEEITKPALKKNLSENRDLADLSLFLVTIRTDADIAVRPEDTLRKNLYTKEAYDLFLELGFRNYLSRFDNMDTKAEAEKTDFEIIFEKKGLLTLQEELTGSSSAVALFPYSETDRFGLPKELLGLAVSANGKQYYIDPDDEKHNAVTHTMISDFLKSLRKNAATKESPCALVLWRGKDLFPYMGIHAEEEFKNGISFRGLLDVHLAAYLIDPIKGEYTPEDTLQRYTGKTLSPFKELLQKKSLREKFSEDKESLMTYACSIAEGFCKSAESIVKELEEKELFKLYEETELPVSYILYDMQRIGIRADAKALEEYGALLTGRIEELDKSIHEAAGEDFNIASPKQLGTILFEKMNLPGAKKTKSGYSTAADVLEKLSADYPIVRDILEYRGLTKLKSTYADALASYIAEDGRIHTSFHQTVTATGRLSASDPNLQNIPMRTELGKRIRKCFLPREGYTFTDADYSQIELRLLAHMSADENLIEAYREDEDIHRITASKVFHTPLEEVTPTLRSNAKAVNFGIVYGISSFGLSQNLSISRAEAADYIKAYFLTYPGVKAYLDGLVESAKQSGYVRTLYGRIRPIPELKNANFMQRQFGERVAMNSPIQGTAADIMKTAMVRVWEALKKNGLQSRMILQIHDELLIETAPGEEETVRKLLKEEMENAAALKVKLEVSVESGEDWYMAK